MTVTDVTPVDYRAATEAAAYYQVPNPGYLVFSGETRREYIQRQTTNDIDLLTPAHALPTLLTAPTGRILEYYMLLESGHSIIMLTQPGHGLGNAAYFQMRIFFNDRVTIQDQSSQWAQIELLGPKTPEILEQFKINEIPELNEEIETEWQGVKLRIFRQLGFGETPRFRFVFPSKLATDFINRLEGKPSLSFDTREILRIESGHAGDPEFAAEATPFELGMDHLVSTTKGCYTGQEVLARQVTYDKVARKLVRLESDRPMTAKTAIAINGKTVGQITSTAISPRLGPIALGIVRKPYDAGGTELTAQDGKSKMPIKVRNS